MARPVVTATAEALFASLGPWARADGESTGWHLLLMCEAIANPLDYVENLSRESAGGIGWSAIMDADRVPAEAEGFLGQMVGVAVPAGIDLASARALIKTTGGFNRGNLASVQGAPGPYLTGTKKVVVKERTTDAYHYTVITYTAETPTPALVLAALIAQKPGGDIMTYITQNGPVINQLLGSINTQVGSINHYATVVP